MCRRSRSSSAARGFPPAISPRWPKIRTCSNSSGARSTRAPRRWRRSSASSASRSCRASCRSPRERSRPRSRSGAARCSSATPISSKASTPTEAGRREAAGYAYVAGATLFWGTSACLARFLFKQGVPALVVVEVRLAVASLALGVWMLLFRRGDLAVPRGAWRWLFLVVLGVATVQASYYTTVSLVGVGLAILLQYLAPALV